MGRQSDFSREEKIAAVKLQTERWVESAERCQQVWDLREHDGKVEVGV